MDGVKRLGVDPGETTGVALFKGSSLLFSDNISGGVEGFVEWWRDWRIQDKIDHIVIENFVVEPSFTGIPVASEIIGAVKVLRNTLPITLQSRSDKATLFNQVKRGDAGEAERFAWLEDRGFVRIGKGHNLDAITHVLVERKRARDPEFWAKYWAD